MPVPNSLKRILPVGTINICSPPKKIRHRGLTYARAGAFWSRMEGITAHQLDE